jgi:hypothetical protein
MILAALIGDSLFAVMAIQGSISVAIITFALIDIREKLIEGGE